MNCHIFDITRNKQGVKNDDNYIIYLQLGHSGTFRLNEQFVPDQTGNLTTKSRGLVKGLQNVITLFRAQYRSIQSLQTSQDYRVYKKNGVHLLCQIISKLLKLIAQFWTCFKPRSFLFRTSRNSYFYFQ